MDAQQFLKEAQSVPEVADYLDALIAESDGRRDAGSSAIFAIAAYALYRYAKNYLDYQRGLLESALRAELEAEVKALVDAGWSRDKALAAVLRISKEIASLRQDDAMLRAAMRLLGK